ncbi:MAG: hypothetical protein ACRDJ4_11955 [Actinomycetota bacterium]
MRPEHGSPMFGADEFLALPEDVREELRSDLARLQANLPEGEIAALEPIGLGATSGGLLVVRTARAAYQLMDDGSTMRAVRSEDGFELTRFRDGQVISNPPKSPS